MKYDKTNFTKDTLKMALRTVKEAKKAGTMPANVADREIKRLQKAIKG